MTEKFYDKYWQEPQKAPPTTDPLSNERLQIFLKNVPSKINKFVFSPRSKIKVLDYGCGAGNLTNALLQLGFEVTGVDISSKAIKYAQKHYPNVPFIKIEKENRLPLKDNEFEAIYCTEVIEHIYDIELLIREFSRLLKKNGILFISTPYHGLAKNLLISAAGFNKHFDPAGPHIRFFTKKSLKNLLVKNGFEISNIYYLGRFWPFWMDMVFLSRHHN